MTRIGDYMYIKRWDVMIIHVLTSKAVLLNHVEIDTWMSNHIKQKTIDTITYPCQCLTQSPVQYAPNGISDSSMDYLIRVTIYLSYQLPIYGDWCHATALVGILRQEWTEAFHFLPLSSIKIGNSSQFILMDCCVVVAFGFQCLNTNGCFQNIPWFVEYLF